VSRFFAAGPLTSKVRGALRHGKPAGGSSLKGDSAAAAAIATLVAGPAIRAQEQAAPRFGERVDVARIIIDARVLDDRGNPIHGLTADDFNVSIDGQTARVETATWVDGRTSNLDLAPPESSAFRDNSAPTDPGRLIVFLFQKDYEPSRIFGLMQMLLKSRTVLGTLTPNDGNPVVRFAPQGLDRLHQRP